MIFTWFQPLQTTPITLRTLAARSMGMTFTIPTLLLDMSSCTIKQQHPLQQPTTLYLSERLVFRLMEQRLSTLQQAWQVLLMALDWQRPQALLILTIHRLRLE